MRNILKRLASIGMILIVLITLFGAACPVSFAEESYVAFMNGSRWVWPGNAVWHIIEFSKDVRDIMLQYYDEEENGWVDYAMPAGGQQCSIRIKPNDFVGASGEGEVYFRYRYSYSSQEYYSDVFLIAWTSFLGKYRIAGSNRYETALLIAKERMGISGSKTYPNAVIACGTNFADALGGTYLAAQYDAPILLVNDANAIMEKMADSVKNNMEEGGTVFILGGEGAVQPYMEEALAQRGITNVVRFAGASRYDTNLQILEYCGIKGKSLMVCCGTSFADALSASAYGYPILLTGKTLTGEQEAFISENLPSYANMIGGQGAVSTSVEKWFRGMNVEGRRYAGSNRYETSFLLAMDYCAEQSYYAVLAYGMNFPDGLAGGLLAYQLGAPLFLVSDKNNNYYRAEQFVCTYNDCRVAVTLGGPSLISEATVDRILLGTDNGSPGHSGYGAPKEESRVVPGQISELDTLNKSGDDHR